MAVETKDFLGYKQAQPFKFKQRVVGGKLVDIDPTTDQPFKKGAKEKYLQQRRKELSAIGAFNRQRLKGHVSKLLHSSPTISTLLKINKQRQEEKRAILEKRAPWDLSEVPVSNFDPSILQAEGLGDKEYLTNSEADRLFRRQELEGEIQQAKFNTANEREIRLNAQSKSPKIRTSLAGDDNFGLGIGPVDTKWMPSGMEVGTQVDGIPQGPLDKPITTTTKEKTDDTNKAIKEVEKNSAFTNSASGNGTADTMKIANKDLRYDDPNYKLTSIQQKLVDGGWTRKELQIKREQHQKWLKDNNRI